MNAAAGMVSTTDAINLTSAVTKGTATWRDAVKRAADLAFTTQETWSNHVPPNCAEHGSGCPLARQWARQWKNCFASWRRYRCNRVPAEVSTQPGVSYSRSRLRTGNTSTLFEKWGRIGRSLLSINGLARRDRGIVQKPNRRVCRCRNTFRVSRVKPLRLRSRWSANRRLYWRNSRLWNHQGRACRRVRSANWGSTNGQPPCSKRGKN